MSTKAKSIKTSTPLKHQHGHECLHLDPKTREDALLRLKSVRGHLEGVLRMLEDESVYCVDVLKQVKAIQGALGKVSEKVLRSHIHDHVVTASERGDTEAIVDELMEALKYQ
jgi:DNA-binding FrmR family transcriptional regulator